MRLLFKPTAVALTALALLAPAVVSPASAQTKYTITDLGGNTYPQGVNDSGSVAGHVKYPATRTSAEYRRAFVRINGSQSEIGTLGGKASEAHAINNSNQVVGQSLNAAGAPRAFLYENGVMKDLNLVKGTDGKSAADLYPGWTLEAAYGINNNGQVVGYWTHPSQVPGQGNSFRWQRDAIGNVSVTAVDLLTRQYQTRGINDAGLVAGGVEYIATDGGGIELSTTQASIWQDGAGNTNLGILHADDLVSHANSINNSSEVVGGSSSAIIRAFLWSPTSGGMVDLGALGAPERSGLGSSAFNNNDAGQVVGWADRNTQYDNDPQYSRAAVWNPNSNAANGMKVQDLNSVSNVGTSWYLQQARDINNKGLIVGNGSVKVKNGTQPRGFLLTPQ